MRVPLPTVMLVLVLAMLTDGAASQLMGSGFIAVYVTGLFLGNNTYSNQEICVERLKEALLPFNTMTEIIVFLSFGLIMDPTRVFLSLDDGAVIALFLMLVARPVSVFLFQPFSPFRLKDSLFISWCGLRGAVPLALTVVVVDKIPKITTPPSSSPRIVGNCRRTISSPSTRAARKITRNAPMLSRVLASSS